MRTKLLRLLFFAAFLIVAGCASGGRHVRDERLSRLMETRRELEHQRADVVAVYGAHNRAVRLVDDHIRLVNEQIDFREAELDAAARRHGD